MFVSYLHPGTTTRAVGNTVLRFRSAVSEFSVIHPRHPRRSSAVKRGLERKLTRMCTFDYTHRSVVSPVREKGREKEEEENAKLFPIINAKRQCNGSAKLERRRKLVSYAWREEYYSKRVNPWRLLRGHYRAIIFAKISDKERENEKERGEKKLREGMEKRKRKILFLQNALPLQYFRRW